MDYTYDFTPVDSANPLSREFTIEFEGDTQAVFDVFFNGLTITTEEVKKNVFTKIKEWLGGVLLNKHYPTYYTASMPAGYTGRFIKIRSHHEAA